MFCELSDHFKTQNEQMRKDNFPITMATGDVYDFENVLLFEKLKIIG